MTRPWRRVTPETRRKIIRMAAEGHGIHAIAAAVNRSSGSVHLVVAPLGGVLRKDMWQPSERRLSIEERVEIRLGVERGDSLRAIARRIDRAPSTVSREVKANGGRCAYVPMTAHRKAAARARRPKVTKLCANPELLERVSADLRALWSPQQIAQRLRTEFGDDDSMQISHETIYRSLYVQGRGELRRELARCLRSGRTRRVRRSRLEKKDHIKGMVMISERPAEAEDRAVPGHWEGDLLMGKDGNSAIGTLVERATRFVMLFPLTEGKTAEHVRVAMTKTVQTLPAALRRSLTWDQGREMTQHVQFKIDTGIDVFFCDPHSPWQRGSNENTNGLLRQYFPKGMDLSKVTEDQLRAAADGLNGRPRQTLGWMKPAEKLAEFVASTD